MASYRIYCLDGAGHIALAEWIEAENDAQAIAKARATHESALRCEVWQGQRLVATLAAEKRPRRPVNPPPDRTSG